MKVAEGVHWDDLPRLRQRAISVLEGGPARARALAETVFGIRSAPPRLATRLVREVLAGDPRFRASGGRWLLNGLGSEGPVPLDRIDFVVVDVETTGGSPELGDRITELAALRLCGGRIIGELESLVNPERPIPTAVTGLTQITDRMVARAPRFSQLADRVRRALEGAIFVAHNVSFDWRFVQAEFERCRGGRLDGDRLCTLRLARRLHPELSRRNLPALTDYYSIDFERWHRAGPDARATADLFLRFLERLSEVGVDSWDALQAYLEPGAAANEDADRAADVDGAGGG